jgi:hypothetical protein
MEGMSLMSVAAVQVYSEKIVIGTDSIRVTGWTQEKDKDAKLFQINDLTVAWCGNCSEGNLFRLFCQTHKPDSQAELSIIRFFNEFLSWYRIQAGNSAEKLSNEYLVVFGDAVFFFHSFYVRLITDYYAIGAGSDFALAGLYFGESVQTSLKVACQLSMVCEEPINILEIRK